MQYQSMPKAEGLTEIGDMRRVKKCTDPNIRFVLQRRKLTGTPKGIENIQHIPRVEFDLSYNRTLRHDEVFNELAKYPNIKGLGLIKHEMGTLPASIGLLENLEVLELWSNKLKELPSSFAQLKNLTYLNLRNNSLKEIPDYFADFKKLKSLNLQFNKVKKIPDFIFDLTELEYLNIATCGLKEIPAGIGKLKKLKTLIFSKNDIVKLPDEIKELKELEIIDFSGNKKIDLEHLFDSLSHLPKIKELNLAKYGLAELPESIGKIKGLKKINLSDNKLESLPRSFAQLDPEELHIQNNHWNLEKLLPVLGKMEWFKDLQANLFPELATKNYHLPDAIGECKHLESITFSNCDGLTVSPAIRKLKNLKSISFYGKMIDKIPEGIKEIQSLESLRISNCNSLTEFPTFIYEMHQLKELTFMKNGCEVDQVRMGSMKGLEKITCTEVSDKLFKNLKNYPNLKQIYFAKNENVKKLPDSFFDMEQVESIYLSGLTNIDAGHFAENMHRLKNLKDLRFNGNANTSFIQFAKQVKGVERLETLHIPLHEPLTAEELMAFSHLKDLTLFVSHRGRNNFSLPLEFALFPSGVLKVYYYTGRLKLIEEIKNYLEQHFEKSHPQYLTYYSLLQKDFNALLKIVENPFDKKEKLSGANIFIAGRPSSGTLKELQEKLKNRGAKITKKLDEKTTHIFITPKVKEDNLKPLLGDWKYILEDHLKEKEIEEDTPYLMEEANSELVAQVTNLLKSRHEEQIPLMLELMEGGGATKKLIGYLGAIHLFHDDTAIRRKSRNLFRKFASSSLQEYVKEHWRASYRGKDIYRFKRVLDHPEWDGGAFIHAWKMVGFYNSKKKGIGQLDQADRMLGNIKLQDLPSNAFTASLSDIDNMEHLTISLNGPLDWDLVYKVIKDKKLQTFACQQKLPAAPTAILAIPTLRTFSGGKWSEESTFDFADIKVPNPNLNSLTLQFCTIKNLEQINMFPNLEQLNFNNCQIDDVHKLTELKNLKNISLTGVKIEKLNKSFEKLNQLSNISVSDNGLKEIDLNFSAFKSLERLTITKNEITHLPDTFQYCQNLNYLTISHNKLETLPLSLFKIKSLKSYPTLNIDAQKNQIKQIGESIKKESNKGFLKNIFGKKEVEKIENQSQLANIKLGNNLLKKIPTILFSLSKIHTIIISENPIEEIPDTSAWDGTILQMTISGGSLKRIPAFIFGKKTVFHIYVQNEGVELPSPEAITPFNNVRLRGNRNLTELNEKINALNKKMQK